MKGVTFEESEQIEDFFSKKNLPAILGSRDFVEWVKTKYYQAITHDEVSQAKDLSPIINVFKQAVGLCYKIDIKELEKSKRGREKKTRNMVIYPSRKYSGLSLAEIGKEFGVLNTVP